MRSSIDLSFEGGQRVDISKDLRAAALSKAIASGELSGRFRAEKDVLKVTNFPLGDSDL